MSANLANEDLGKSVLRHRNRIQGKPEEPAAIETEGLIKRYSHGDKGLHLYCIPGIGFEPGGFRVLGDMLPEWPIFSFNPPLDTEGDNPTYTSSITSLAKRYVDAINEFQPFGPLALAGSSIGATIALEIARQLSIQGRDVRFLAAIDFGPVTTPAHTQGRTMHHLISTYYELGRKARLKRDVALRVAEELKQNPNPVALYRTASQKLAERREKEEAEKPYQYPVIENNIPRGVIDLSKFTPARQKIIVRLYNSGEVYQAAPYRGRVIAYAATAQPNRHEKKVAALWKHIAEQLEIVDIEGMHAEIGNSPQLVAHLGERLRMFEMLDLKLKAIFSQNSARRNRGTLFQPA